MYTKRYKEVEYIFCNKRGNFSNVSKNLMAKKSDLLSFKIIDIRIKNRGCGLFSSYYLFLEINWGTKNECLILLKF